VRLEMERIRAVHPDPFHATPEPVFQAAADDLAARADGLSRDRLLVELMRFTNLLGELEVSRHTRASVHAEVDHGHRPTVLAN